MLLGGYLILIRFVAVIMISILASLFLEHTVLLLQLLFYLMLHLPTKPHPFGNTYSRVMTSYRFFITTISIGHSRSPLLKISNILYTLHLLYVAENVLCQSASTGYRDSGSPAKS